MTNRIFLGRAVKENDDEDRRREEKTRRIILFLFDYWIFLVRVNRCVLK